MPQSIIKFVTQGLVELKRSLVDRPQNVTKSVHASEEIPVTNYNFSATATKKKTSNNCSSSMCQHGLNNFCNVRWPIHKTPFQLDQSMRNEFYDTLRQNLCFALYYYQGCSSTHGNLREHLDAGIKCKKYIYIFILVLNFDRKNSWKEGVYCLKLDIYYSICM